MSVEPSAVSAFGWRPSATSRIETLVSAAVALLCVALIVYPFFFLLAESINIGDPQTFPPTELGFDNFIDLSLSLTVLLNTAYVAIAATIMAVVAGFVLAWILTRTNIPGKALLERLLEIPFYLTPLVGALAWSILAAPKSGFLNQILFAVTGIPDILDIYTPFGIAWVMALFEGTVAFVMIAAVMKSMDPSLEESSRVTGAGKLRTLLKITVPLVLPGLLGAVVFVFAEMLGSFAAALVLGLPGRFFVVTTAIWQYTLSYPPEYGKASALGLALFGVMFLSLSFYRWMVRRATFATISGKAFQPRSIDMGSGRYWLAAICWLYVFVAVVLPIAALLLTSCLRFATVIIDQMSFTLRNYETAFTLDAVRTALMNSLVLGIGVATVGVVVMAILAWIIYRGRVPGGGAIEYVVMFPQSVPRMVFGLALLTAWLNIPIPLYGTLWVLAIAYFTVLLPLGVRALGGVVLQIDKSLEECAQICGASWAYRMKTITLPLLRPGLVAAWLLVFIASVREIGVSIYLMGPNSKVIAPAIVSSWSSSGTELTAAMAIIQTAVVLLAVVILMYISGRYAKGA
jgi:iron(III) transport system permease protein